MKAPIIKCNNPECGFEGMVVFKPRSFVEDFSHTIPLEHVYCPFCGCPPQKKAPRNVWKLRWYRLRSAFAREALHSHLRLMEKVEKLTVAGKEWE